MQLDSQQSTIRYVAGLMNDLFPGQEHVRWPLDLMKGVYAEAISAVNMFRPDAVSSVVTMELQPGAMQTAPEGCESVAKVFGQIDPDTGNVTAKAEKSNSAISKWFPNNCSAVDGYELQGYEVEESVEGVFFVDPPVPKGEKVQVALACVGGCAPDATDCRYTPAVIEYMMYRLYGSEDDSATSQGIMNTHLKNFATFLGINYQMAQSAMGKDNGIASASANQPQ